MNKPRTGLHLAGTALAALTVTAACGTSSASPEAEPEPGPDESAIPCPTEGDEWEVAKVYIEHNATDADTGIHGFVGGSPWRSVCVIDPGGTPLWVIEPAGRLGQLGVSDTFWESNEPPNDEYSIDDLKADFPEGDYSVAGTGIDGVDRIARAHFTHAIPTPPEITHPPLVPDLDGEDPPPVAGSGLVVRWEPVTTTIDGDPLTVSGYQVIVTEEEASDPNGFARPIYDVHVEPDVTALPVPDEFLASDTVYELEVLAIEPSGNQTISVGFFRTT